MQHTQAHNRKGMSNATAGAVGAAVGGIVGAAAGIALSDSQKRKMMLSKMDDLKRYIAKALDEISQMSQTTSDVIDEQPIRPKTVKKAKTQKRQVN